MKVAICYFGKIGAPEGDEVLGVNTPDSIEHLENCYNSVKKYIINNNKNCEFDIFIHSWSYKYNAEIVNILKPNEYKIEPQISFMQNALTHLQKHKKYKSFVDMIKFKIKFIISKSYKDEYYSYLINNLQKLYSRWYSTLQVNILKNKYEENNNFKYDLVILNRFDNFFYNYLDLNKIDNSKIYSSKWDCGRNIFLQKQNFDNKHTQDYWYISSSENINIFSQLFNFLEDYSPCNHRSSFQHMKRFFGLSKLDYILELRKDYEIYRLAKKYKYYE